MNSATLCFLINDKKVLLGMKKKGFGAGKWNGFGGKVNENESIEEAAIREMREESGVAINSAEKLAELIFVFPHKKEWDQTVHVFVADEWSGEIMESDEMHPEWFDFSEIPFDRMWADDKFWLPLVLENKNVKAKFVFKEDNETIERHEILTF